MRKPYEPPTLRYLGTERPELWPVDEPVLEHGPGDDEDDDDEQTPVT